MFNKYFKSKKLVCFDFDGLLVDTEPLHHEAYTLVLEKLGFPLPLDFPTYCSIAHSPDRLLLKKAVREKHPHFDLNWEFVRDEKTKIYRQLLSQGKVKAMPGAEKLVKALKKNNISICIVTNSDRCDVDEIAKHLTFLQEIPLKITREDYDLPKPSPDGYLKALRLHKVSKEEAIGLEDTEKGLSALNAAGVQPLFVNRLIDKQCDVRHLSLEPLSAE